MTHPHFQLIMATVKVTTTITAAKLPATIPINFFVSSEDEFEVTGKLLLAVLSNT